MGLLDNHVRGTVLLASWLEKNGISRDLQQYYLKSGWLESYGIGTFKRPNENVQWTGALNSLQSKSSPKTFAGVAGELQFNQSKTLVFVYGIESQSSVV